MPFSRGAGRFACTASRYRRIASATFAGGAPCWARRSTSAPRPSRSGGVSVIVSPVRERSTRRSRSWKTAITAALTPSTSSTIASVTERRDGVLASGDGSQTFQTETQTSTAASGKRTSGAISAPTQRTAAVAVPLSLLIGTTLRHVSFPVQAEKEGAMAKLGLGQLASVGEGALGKLAQNPV